MAACAPGGDPTAIDPDFVNDLIDEAKQVVVSVSWMVESMAGSGSTCVERLAGSFWHSPDDFGEVAGPFETLHAALDSLDFGGGLENPEIFAIDEVPLDVLKSLAIEVMDLANDAECTINDVNWRAIRSIDGWTLVQA